jgi:hypothetical protein
MLKLLKLGQVTARTKDFEVMHHAIRQRIAAKELRLEYCRTDDMAADFLTKALGKVKLQTCMERLGIRA